MSWLDYVPGVSNIKGAIQGNAAQALGGAGYKILDKAQNAMAGPGANTAAAGNEITENDQRRAQFAQDFANYQNRQAPRQDNMQMGIQQRAEAPQVNPQQRAAGPASFIAAQAGATPVAATQVGPTTGMVAAGLNPAAQASAGTAFNGAAQAGQINTGGEVRNQQMGALGDLQAASHGEVPSAAEEQMQRGTAANIAGQYAMARTAHGAGRVGALESAQTNAEQANADLTGRTAELRANEQAQARGQYAQALQGTRGQDIGAETTNAQLGTDVSKFNTGLGADVSKFNAGEAGNTSRFNTGQTNETDLARAKFAQDAASQNAGAANTANLEQARINAGANSQSSAQGTDVSKFNAGAADTMNRFNETNRQNNEQFNASQGNDYDKFLAAQAQNNSQFNAGQGNDMNKFGANLNYQVGANNLRSGIDVMQMDDAQKRAYMDFITQSQGQSINGANNMASNQQKAQDSRYDRRMDFVNLGKGLATGGAIG